MNKKYDLVALGNGLVDLQFIVNSSELDDLNLKKGEMRLAEGEEQKILIQKMAHKQTNICSGGSAANSIIVFSALGGKAAYMTTLGDDKYGHFYANEFKQLGIDLHTEFIQSEPTGTCAVLITEDSERTMLTHLAATSHFTKDSVEHNLIKDSKWLYIEGYKFSQPESTEAIFKSIETARQSNTKIALTFSDLFIINLFKDNLIKVAEVADLIFCNEQEAFAFTGTNSDLEAIEFMKNIAPGIVITQGARGSIVYWDDQTLKIPPFPTNPIDTTGAGDAFAGAFLYGIIKELSIYKAGELASYISSKIVSQLGARFSEDLAVLRDSIIVE